MVKRPGITRQAAADLLAEMPGAFSVTDFCRDSGIATDQASTYLTRWEQDGLIARFGVGVFLNLVKDPDARKTQPGAALEVLLQRPFVMVGGAALYHAGWTGQIHRRIEIAVSVAKPNVALPILSGGFVLVPRFPKQIQTLLDHIEPEASGWERIPVAAPAYALADMFASMPAVPKAEQVKAVPPDELDPDMIEGDQRDSLLQALKDFGASPALRDRVMAEYSGVLSGSGGPDRFPM